ncbi:partitioning defective 3 homolog isoform X1 [Tachysurus ichikawai]
MSFQDGARSPSVSEVSLNRSLDDHERRISHSMYPGSVEGLDDPINTRSIMGRMIVRVPITVLAFEAWKRGSSPLQQQTTRDK